MFQKGSTSTLRKYVLDEIGEASWLRGLQTRDEFDFRFYGVVDRFPSSVRMNPNARVEKPSFGHKAKIVSLYFKAVLTEREPLDNETAHRVRPWFHVPLDNIVLNWIMAHFGADLAKQGVGRDNLRLSTLRERDYRIVQQLLRSKAEEAQVPPIWYDDLWADRDEENDS